MITKDIMTQVTLEYIQNFTQKLEETLVKNIKAFEGENFDIKDVDPELLHMEQDLKEHKNYYYYRGAIIVIVDFNMFDAEGELKGYTIYSKM